MKYSQTILLLFVFTLFSCSKDKTCPGIEISESEVIIGNWRWFKTEAVYKVASQSPPVYFDLTPQPEGYTYSFTLNTSGQIAPYRNGIPENTIVLNSMEIDDIDSYGMTRYYSTSFKCDTLPATLLHELSNTTNDTIAISSSYYGFPYVFWGEVPGYENYAHSATFYNWFVRE